MFKAPKVHGVDCWVLNEVFACVPCVTISWSGSDHQMCCQHGSQGLWDLRDPHCLDTHCSTFSTQKGKLCYKEPTPIPTSQDTHSCQKSVYRAMAMRDAYKGSFRSLSFWCTMHTLSLSLGHFMSSVFMICMCYVRMCYVRMCYVCAMYVCMYLTLDCLCTYICVYVSVCVNTVLKYSSSERSYS